MRKIPGIKQHHVSDCGAACLASVAAWFGLRFPLEHIRQISGTQTHGISVQGIREGAAALHLKASAYRLEDNVPAEKKAAALEKLPFPSILHQIRPNGHTISSSATDARVPVSGSWTPRTDAFTAYRVRMLRPCGRG